MIAGPNQQFPTIYPAPAKKAGIATLKITLSMEQFAHNNFTNTDGWLMMGSVTETVVFSVDNDKPTQEQ